MQNWKYSILYLLLVVVTVPAAAQTVTGLGLPDAVAIALEKNPARKMAVADSQMAKAQVSLAKSSYFPRVSFTETATLGNDPVYAFGTRLRQARFTQADFALDRLNYPDPISNFSTKLGGQWNVFDFFQKNFQIRQAKSMEQASQQQLSRADQEVVFRVIDAYYAVGLARKQVEMAEQTLKTSKAMLDSSTARVEAGAAVESDALSARVNVASREQESIQAKSALRLALTQLETAMGMALPNGQEPTAVLNEKLMPVEGLEEFEARALKQRPDLLAIGSQVDAQQNGVKAAKAAYGPRLDVFGSWQADNASLAANGSTNWMTGVELRVDLFARDREARLSMQKAMLSRAEAARKMAEDNVRMELRKAWLEHDATRQMLEVSRASVKQAEESLRIMRDRYETGLVTITDLLRAEDADRASRTNYWQSVYRNIVSYAALELASGALTPQNSVVTQ
ncbi:MAG TPA: TolC family protein [Terriglobales bacterium]|nr:TolC family protein [Terriglobales bacterium]